MPWPGPVAIKRQAAGPRAYGPKCTGPSISFQDPAGVYRPFNFIEGPVRPSSFSNEILGGAKGGKQWVRLGQLQGQACAGHIVENVSFNLSFDFDARDDRTAGWITPPPTLPTDISLSTT